MVPLLRATATALSLVIFTTLLTSCGGKDTHAKIMEDNLVLMEQVATLMEGVEDEESAKAAAKKLEALSSKFDEIAERNEAIGKPDEETEKALKKEYGDRVGAAIGKVTTGLRNPAAGEPSLQRALQGLGNITKRLR